MDVDPALPALNPLSHTGNAAPATQQLIERYADAWLRDDRAAAVACYHEDFTLHYYGRNALSGDHVGKAQCLATLRELARRTGWRVLEIKQRLSGVDCAALVAHMQYRSSGAPLERERVLIFAVRDGLLRECWAYDQDPALLDALIGPQ